MDKKSFYMVLTTGILWGTSCLFVTELSQIGLNSWQITFFRYAVSGIIMLLTILLKDRNTLNLKTTQIPLIFLSGISLFGTSAFYFASINASSPSTAVILMYTAPTLVTIYSSLFMREKMTARKIFAVIISLLGCLFVAGFPFGLRFSIKGMVFGLLSSLSYATYTIVTKIQTKKKFNSKGVTVYNFLIAAFVSIFFAYSFNFILTIRSMNLHNIITVVGLAIFTALLPYFLYTLALKKLSLSICSVMTTIEPMFATLFSIIFLKEKLTFFSGLGIILILLSMIITAFSDTK